MTIGMTGITAPPQSGKDGGVVVDEVSRFQLQLECSFLSSIFTYLLPVSFTTYLDCRCPDLLNFSFAVLPSLRYKLYYTSLT